MSLAEASVIGIKFASIDPTNRVTPYPKATPVNAVIIPARGFLLFSLNMIAANGINTTYPISLIKLETVATNNRMNVIFWLLKLFW